QTGFRHRRVAEKISAEPFGHAGAFPPRHERFPVCGTISASGSGTPFACRTPDCAMPVRRPLLLIGPGGMPRGNALPYAKRRAHAPSNQCHVILLPIHFRQKAATETPN